MTVLNPSDFMLKVARGDINGYTSYNRYGLNEDVDSTPAEDIIEQGGSITFPTAAETLEIVSADADDNATGNGAREVTIYGLDSTFALQTQTVNPNGVSAQSISGTWRRVFRAWVSDSGTSQGNEGQLTIRVSGGGATRLIIAATKGQTNFLCHSIPINTTGFLTDIEVGTADGGGTALVTFTLKVRHEINDATHRGIVRVKNQLVVPEGAFHHLDFRPYISIAGPADVWVSADADTNNTSVYGSFDLIVVDD